MSRPKIYRGGLPTPDAFGRWRPFVGRDTHGKQVRFQVGNKRDTSEAEALKKLNAIRDLYARQCVEYGIDHWHGFVHDWATRLAQQCPLVVHASTYAQRNPGQAAEELSWVRKLQAWGVPIITNDSRLASVGLDSIQKHIDAEVQRAVATALADLKASWGSEIIQEAQQAMPSNLAAAPQGQFHDALEAFKDHIEATGTQDRYGNLSANNRKYLEWLDVLAEHHQDFSLWQLTFQRTEEIIGYWRNRPKTKKRDRCSAGYSTKLIRQFLRFLKWLDRQPQYRWELPRGVEDIKKKPIELKSDKSKHPTAFRSLTKNTYTPEQLAVLAQHTDAFGKALLGVCVNCAFGASEVGQLDIEAYQLHVAHPYASALGIESTDKDSWVVGQRPKTAGYGEHLLWDEVALAVKPFLSDGRQVLPVSENGKPWYRPHSKNAQSGFQNWFNRLLKRIRMNEAHKEFPRLPFGSLRDVLPDVLRSRYSDSIASLSLQHGRLSEDNLLNNYANLPYAKLFQATRELRAHFQPFVRAVGQQE